MFWGFGENEEDGIARLGCQFPMDRMGKGFTADDVFPAVPDSLLADLVCERHFFTHDATLNC